MQFIFTQTDLKRTKQRGENAHITCKTTWADPVPLYIPPSCGIQLLYRFYTHSHIPYMIYAALKKNTHSFICKGEWILKAHLASVPRSCMEGPASAAWEAAPVAAGAAADLRLPRFGAGPAVSAAAAVSSG